MKTLFSKIRRRQSFNKQSIYLNNLKNFSINANNINIDFIKLTNENKEDNFYIKNAPNSEAIKQMKTILENDGILQIDNLLDEQTTEVYASLYSKFLSKEINAESHRHDLGSFKESKDNKENVCQIMWPSLYINSLLEGPLHQRTKYLSKVFFGKDMEFDFDMLIYKSAHSSTEFPWHQDEGYWTKSGKIQFTDLRGLSFWVALNDATLENGCMWYAPGTHKHGLFKHKEVKEGHHTIVVQDADDLINNTKKPYQIKKGSVLVSNGRVLHYSGPNISDNERKAFIINYRPIEVINYMRQNGFDHGKSGLHNLGIDNIKKL